MGDTRTRARLTRLTIYGKGWTELTRRRMTPHAHTSAAAATDTGRVAEQNSVITTLYLKSELRCVDPPGCKLVVKSGAFPK